MHKNGVMFRKFYIFSHKFHFFSHGKTVDKQITGCPVKIAKKL